MQTILFIELLGGIGDVVIALAAMQAIARSHPQARLTVLTFAPGAELLATEPLIQEVIECDRTDPPQALAALLAERSFDLIVSDTNYGGIEAVIQAAGCPWTVTNLWRSPPPEQRVGDRFLEILLTQGVILPTAIAPAQLHLTPQELQAAEWALAEYSRPLVFLFADAGMAVKRWPLAHFVTVGQTLRADYGATLLVPVGSEPEQAAAVVAGIGEGARIWPRGGLRSLAAAIAQADLFLAADTGTARIAAALRVPTVTLFGPSWSGRYGQPAPHVNLQGYPECSERVIADFTRQRCWYDGVCPLERWQSCLEEISPAVVLGVLGEMKVIYRGFSRWD